MIFYTYIKIQLRKVFSMHAQVTNIKRGIIDFCKGHPSDTLLPTELFAQTWRYQLQQSRPAFLQYGDIQGDNQFRQLLANFLTSAYKKPVSHEQLLITGGASQGLDLICTLFTKPGDVIFIEEPSYFLVFKIFAEHHLQLISVPVDEQGLIVDGLEEKLAAHKPALLYTIPVFHNPAGSTLSDERRQQLVKLSEKYNFTLIADEVYQLLNYGTEIPPPFMNYDRKGTVLSLGSFSKILAPGLRLGWIQANPTLIKQLLKSGVLNSGGGTNHFTVGIIQDILLQGFQESYLAHLRDVYGNRARKLSAALRNHLPAEVRFYEPQGGYFIWLRFPESIDTSKFLEKARDNGVIFHPGYRFSAARKLQNCMRLSFSYHPAGELEKGAEKLGSVIHNIKR